MKLKGNKFHNNYSRSLPYAFGSEYDSKNFPFFLYYTFLGGKYNQRDSPIPNDEIAWHQLSDADKPRNIVKTLTFGVILPEDPKNLQSPISKQLYSIRYEIP